jgi:site-specific DNA recombinase
MLKAAAYARFSSDRQREESVEAQLRDNKKYALKNNLSVVKEYVDRAETGRTTENREEFQRMIQDSKDGKFDVIIVHKVDKFARNRYESAIYKHNLKKHGVKVAYSAQAIDDSPEGVLMEGMLESFAEYYSLNLGVEVMKGLKENALKAQFNGGAPPLGYDVDENKH